MRWITVEAWKQDRWLIERTGNEQHNSCTYVRIRTYDSASQPAPTVAKMFESRNKTAKFIEQAFLAGKANFTAIQKSAHHVLLLLCMLDFEDKETRNVFWASEASDVDDFHRERVSEGRVARE